MNTHALLYSYCLFTFVHKQARIQTHSDPYSLSLALCFSIATSRSFSFIPDHFLYVCVFCSTLHSITFSLQFSIAQTIWSCWKMFSRIFMNIKAAARRADNNTFLYIYIFFYGSVDRSHIFFPFATSNVRWKKGQRCVFFFSATN